MSKRFFLVGKVPVSFERDARGVRVLAFDGVSGAFEPRPDYWTEIDYDRSGRVREVDEPEFARAVAALRAANGRRAAS